jgi:hypothetical protein
MDFEFFAMVDWIVILMSLRGMEIENLHCIAKNKHVAAMLTMGILSRIWSDTRSMRGARGSIFSENFQ